MRGAKRRWRADPDDPFRFPDCAANGFLHQIEAIKQILAAFQQGKACFGQAHALGCPGKQPGTQPFFQPFHMLGDVSLCHAKPLRCCGKTSSACDFSKNFNSP